MQIMMIWYMYLLQNDYHNEFLVKYYEIPHSNFSKKKKK